MIKPSEVSFAREVDLSAVAALEVYFDQAIREAERSGNWPAIVPARRDGSTEVDIEACARMYREAGWDVTVRVSGHIATIDRRK